MKKIIFTLAAVSILGMGLFNFSVARAANIGDTCKINTDCQGYVCVAGFCQKCHPADTTKTEGASSECDGQGGYCQENGLCGRGQTSGGGVVDACTTPNDCPSDGFACVSGFCSSVAVGTSCKADADCGKNHFCENGSCTAKPPVAAPPNPAPTFEAVTPKLQINIPGVQFSNIKIRPGETVGIPWIMEYIKGIYKYLLGVAILLAIIMISIAGFRWMTAGGNASIIGDAKKQIINAIIGLILAFGVVVVLSTINPNLINLKPISIKTIATETVTIQDSGDTEEDVSSDAYSRPEINCPKSGGAAVIPEIVTGLMGKVTYRMGGKGGLPPYRETNPAYSKYNNSCPSGTLCFDCSGFVNFVLRCAGLSAPGGGTKNIFNSAEKITAIDAASATVTTATGSKPLQIGDLLGYTSGDSSNGIGHVYIYVGEGKLASSNGGDAGRQSGANPKFMSLPSDTKILKMIRRISP